MSAASVIRHIAGKHSRWGAPGITSEFLRSASMDDIRECVEQVVKHELRNAVREIERCDPPKVVGDGALEWTARTLRTAVSLGEGVRLTFGSMTADDHRVRASMLRAHAAGTLDTAERHEQAAEQIEEAGVGCLDDLPAVREVVPA